MAEEYGFIVISRKAYETDPFWKKSREFSEWEAWEDLIQMAAFAAHNRAVGAGVVRIERGEVLAATRFLAKRWQWSASKVHKFIALLTKMGRISASKSTPEGNTYLLTNYDTYQTSGNAKRTRRERQENANETDRERTANANETLRERDENEDKEGNTGKEGELYLLAAGPCGDAPPDEPVEFWIPIKGLVPVKPTRGPVRSGEHGTEFGLTASYVASLVESFPGVDVRQKLVEIIRWNVRNPARRKTYPAKNGGVLEHIEGWLGREQNQARGNAAPRASDRRAPAGLDDARVSQLERLKEAQNR